MRILVTGGAGFIGSALVRKLVLETPHEVVNVDKLTYAGNLESLAEASGHPGHHFERLDICDASRLASVIESFEPEAIIHLAAESHVDRSIDGPAAFIRTNILGTFTLLEAALVHWQRLRGDSKRRFRFLHVSTDEVYGSLGEDDQFVETSPYDPSSPYSASKASADHLVRAWHRTYGLPVVLTNCSNNYGPYQYPEKLIPLTVLNVLEGRPAPVYGHGEHVRDWLFVCDHVDALLAVLERGRIGESYLIGATDGQRRNISVVRAVCALVDEFAPDSAIGSRTGLIQFVADRPGHDLRYAVDASKIRHQLGWTARETFESGLRRTVGWYLANLEWCRRVQEGRYQRERVGLSQRERR